MNELGSGLITGPVALCNPETKFAKAARDLLSDPTLTLNSYTFSTKESRIEGVPDALAANLVISKKAFEKSGGFPDLNFNEDTLFSKKFREGGGKIVYEPKLKCIHNKHFDSLSNFANYFFIYGRNYARVATKLGIGRRYGIVSVFSLLALIALGISLLFNPMLYLYFLIFFGLFFFILLSYSLIKNRGLSSVMIPFLFFVLVFSYLGGFYFGLVRNKK